MITSHTAEILLIEGADAKTFAHAQFSSKVDALAIGQWQFSAWLDPQGRVRFVFHLAHVAANRYLLLLRGGDAGTMADALRRFVFRSRITLTALPPRALATGPALPMHTIGDDVEELSLGCGTHSLRIVQPDHADDAWRVPQLHSGWPWLPAQALDEWLPAALSLQRLQAVAVDKGCYPGQEIVARLHFRGGHKRHLHKITLSRAVSAGDTLRNGDREIASVLDVVVADDRIEALVVMTDEVVAQIRDDRVVALDDDSSMRIDTSWAA
jgi:folate-binding protein YgfZ